MQNLSFISHDWYLYRFASRFKGFYWKILQTRESYVFSCLNDIDSTDSIESSLQLPELNDPQKLGSAITYHRRYTLASLLGLQAVDDDANIASGKVESQVEKKWLNENPPEFSKAIEYIQQGGNVEDIKSKYKVSKKVQDALSKL